MTAHKPIVLDFAMVDDLAMAAKEGIDTGEVMRSVRIDSIGPLVDYMCHQTAQPDHLAPLQEDANSLLACEMLRGLRTNCLYGDGKNSSLVPKTAEFGWLPPTCSDASSPLWTAFRKRVEQAARNAGFPSHVAAGMCASFSEMADNVLVHSGRPQSGFCGYHFAQGVFEYVVADKGIGVLDSLRQSADYRHITDSGTALSTVLRDGESRYGKSSGHGFGFRQIFVSLANQQGHLRFRSDDHALELREVGPSLTNAIISQVSYMKGFMIFVSCRIPSLVANV